MAPGPSPSHPWCRASITIGWSFVDGVAVNDPGSETYFGYGRPTSGIEGPENGVDFYDAKDVPHGEVRAFWHRSKITGTPRRAFVYTPPDYDKTPNTC
jgi:hypothetical protein